MLARALIAFPGFYFLCSIVSLAIIFSSLLRPLSRKLSQICGNFAQSALAPNFILLFDLFSPIYYQLSGDAVDLLTDDRIILTCNHQTYLDFIHTYTLTHLLRKDVHAKFLTRSDLRRLPIIGKVCLRLRSC